MLSGTVLCKGSVEFAEDSQGLFRITFASEQPEPGFSVEFSERYRGPFLDELVKTQATLFGKPLEALMLICQEVESSLLP